MTPVTRGERIAMVFWVQSMVRDAERRAMLFTLGPTLNNLDAKLAPDARADPAVHLLLQPRADVGRAVSFDHAVGDQRFDLRLSVAAFL